MFAGLVVLLLLDWSLPTAQADGPPDPYAELIAGVDQDRYLADVTTLADFGTRYTHSTQIIAAKDWLVLQFNSLGLTTSTPSFTVVTTTAYNVVGELAGSTRPDDIYIVGAHYDSISSTPMTAAPGAEDNASGTAGALELARLFTASPPQATVRFIAFSGEEQGLYGSEDYVADLVAAGEDSRVQGVFIMDMISFNQVLPLDVLLETNYPTGAALLNQLSAAAQGYTSLDVAVSWLPWGSDHVPFLDEGMAAVLSIEDEWASYTCYHEDCDTPDKLNPEEGAEIVKMVAVALAQEAGCTPLGDADSNGLVAGDDLLAIAGDWRGPPSDPRHDLDDDGQVTLLDAQLGGAHWGVRCGP